MRIEDPKEDLGAFYRSTYSNNDDYDDNNDDYDDNNDDYDDNNDDYDDNNDDYDDNNDADDDNANDDKNDCGVLNVTEYVCKSTTVAVLK